MLERFKDCEFSVVRAFKDWYTCIKLLDFFFIQSKLKCNKVNVIWYKCKTFKQEKYIKQYLKLHRLQSLFYHLRKHASIPTSDSLQTEGTGFHHSYWNNKIWKCKDKYFNVSNICIDVNKLTWLRPRIQNIWVIV